MARRRVRAAVRKAAANSVHDEAALIADGVYHVAREVLEGTPRGELPLPVYVFAPLAYTCEMMASVLAKQHELVGREHEIALYLLAGVQEVAVAAFGGFDPEHFDAWVSASAETAPKNG